MTNETDQPLDGLHVAIVLPFLNEQETLVSTCRSLGFGSKTPSTPQGATLFLIDNGSTDESGNIAKKVMSDSLDGTVVIGYEAERGYVPPRHRGNMMAQAFAQATDRGEHDVLILQADADTQYGDGYIEGMRAEMQANRGNVLVEACTAYPSEFKAAYPDYIQLCDKVDEVFAELFAPPDTDIIVDDKVSGYRLDDYFRWGCHQREYTTGKDEIHAETSRLYMKAKAHGAKRLRVESAVAYPSLRKVLEEPALHFASAGFPREANWNQTWRQEYDGPNTLTGFCSNISDPAVRRAIRVREHHLIAMFGVLPLHVSYALNQQVSTEVDELATAVLPLLPKRTADDLQRSPGSFVSDVFDLMDRCGEELIGRFHR